MTSKQEERKALAQIRKIVEGLGENSYIGMALEGCFEIAEQNIENDFGCSMQQRADAAEKKSFELQDKVCRLELSLDAMKVNCKQAENETMRLARIVDEMANYINELEGRQEKQIASAQAQTEELEMANAKIKELQNEIIQLKAKLYDLLVK